MLSTDGVWHSLCFGQKTQVLDEADMLLGGGFVRQVGRLIDLFRLEEKRKFKDMELEKVQERRRKQEELDSRKDYTSATEADDDMVAAKEEDEVFLRSDWTEEQDEHSMATGMCCCCFLFVLPSPLCRS